MRIISILLLWSAFSWVGAVGDGPAIVGSPTANRVEVRVGNVTLVFNKRINTTTGKAEMTYSKRSSAQIYDPANMEIPKKTLGRAFSIAAATMKNKELQIAKRAVRMGKIERQGFRFRQLELPFEGFK